MDDTIIPNETGGINRETDDFENQLMELTREMERRNAEKNVHEVTPTSDVPQPAEALPSAGGDGSQGIVELSRQFKEFTKEIQSTMGVLVEQLKRKNALESANERLFDAMHGELKSYKEATILEAMQKPFLLDLVALKDDIEGVAKQMARHIQDCPQDIQSAAHNLENALHFIDEILARHSVEPIHVDRQMDARTCRVVEAIRSEDESVQPGEIIAVKRCGYRWRGRVLRPVDVIVKASLAKPQAPQAG